MICRDEVTGGWRKLHNEELHYLYSLPSIIRMVKSRRMGWARYLARMVEEESMYVIHGKDRKKELTRKTKTWGGGVLLK
jgi:hypothetical protein